MYWSGRSISTGRTAILSAASACPSILNKKSLNTLCDRNKKKSKYAFDFHHGAIKTTFSRAIDSILYEAAEQAATQLNWLHTPRNIRATLSQYPNRELEHTKSMPPSCAILYQYRRAD